MRSTSRAAAGRCLSCPIRPCSGWGLHGRRVSAPPVSSCLTISTLPQPDCFGGMFLLHFPYSCLRRTLSGIPALRSPDFPHDGRAATRSSGLPPNVSMLFDFPQSLAATHSTSTSPSFGSLETSTQERAGLEPPKKRAYISFTMPKFEKSVRKTVVFTTSS